MLTGLMSEMGQTRKCGRPDGMSVLLSGADIGRLNAQVRFVPGRDSCTAPNGIAIRSLRRLGREATAAS